MSFRDAYNLISLTIEEWVGRKMWPEGVVPLDKTNLGIFMHFGNRLV